VSIALLILRCIIISQTVLYIYLKQGSRENIVILARESVELQFLFFNTRLFRLMLQVSLYCALRLGDAP